MNIALDKHSNQVIDASGKIMEGDPSKQRFLHVLPKLWLPYEEMDVKSDLDCVKLLSLDITELNFSLNQKTHSFIASRPYPNFNHVVFKDENNKLGLYIPLTKNNPKKITIKTYFKIKLSQSEYLKVYSEEHITLNDIDNDNASYSTEQCIPIVIGYEEHERFFKEKDQDNILYFGYENTKETDSLATWKLISKANLNPLVNNFVLASHFEDKVLFRDKPQNSTLTKFNLEHRNNAIVEAPFNILRKAVDHSKLPLTGGMLPQEHPSMKALCDWWNSNNNIPKKLRSAKSCQIFVRINDNDEYQDIDLDVPSFSISGYCESTKECCTRIGQHFLIIYLLGQENCREIDGYVQNYLVNGEVYEESWMPLEDYEIGWQTLENIPEIPYRYPEIYQSYLTESPTS